MVVALFFLSACSPSHKAQVDELNRRSYAFHYRNLDSVRFYANKALHLSSDYGSGKAEALNNLAFVSIVRMDYDHAYKLLNEALATTDNQIELLITDIQMMRLCQRESQNKNFYVFHERATKRVNRILEDIDELNSHQKARFLYAKSELSIVTATYYYYVGLTQLFIKELQSIDDDELEQDTAQYLNYLYNLGAGGAIVNKSSNEVAQEEFDYLMRCYLLSSGTHYSYWEANSLQAISEHLQTPSVRRYLIANNQPAFQYLNIDNMPDSLLAGNLAERSFNLFNSYGDVYQIAGAYRTLAQCYWSIHDYRSAISCLETSLNKNKVINRAPDLVASIREQLSLTYSAIDDKPKSDYNRNIYLDIQEQTRQDRLLEARAEQLDSNSTQLNWMIAAVAGAILLLIILLFFFDYMRRRSEKNVSVAKILQPLTEWIKNSEEKTRDLENDIEEFNENISSRQLHILKNKKRNLEQRAKVQLVNNITPFIDRMLNEIQRLEEGNESEEVKARRYQYIVEITDKINEYNEVLTQWIQMRKGDLSLHIESFPVQPLFDIVKKGRMGYQLKGITLNVEDTDAVVKADRTLTLFMINTIADNARKFTNSGGSVTIKAETKDNCVEFSVVDTGEGMNEEQLQHVFDRTYTGGHGFGLLNCKGIIEKYKKVSSLFSVCDIKAESEAGKGSRFTFRLPKGLVRKVFMIVLLVSSALHISAAKKVSRNMARAQYFADSVYFSNINGNYHRTLEFADSAYHYINKAYLETHPNSTVLIRPMESNNYTPAELTWFRNGVDIDYACILDVRNESAVASLALHDWARYHYNNKVYTSLYRATTADNSLANYVSMMQKTENSKTIAVVLLIILLVLIFLAYFFLYYRHLVFKRISLGHVDEINKVLLSDGSTKEKLAMIRQQWDEKDKNASHKHLEFQPLEESIAQIKEKIKLNMTTQQSIEEKLELAKDELAKAKYEDDKLHISNSVLDNCLSTLKHETMYYPSRIRQLIDGTDNNLVNIRELADYYKSLYSMLSQQCMRQIEGRVYFDKDILKYLFEILEKQLKQSPLKAEKSNKDERYIQLSIPVTGIQLSAEDCENLFSPLTCNINYLLCRQIVRELGEVTNARGSGISASHDESSTRIDIVLPKTIAPYLRNCNLEII